MMQTVKVNGMSCQHCVMAVSKALRGLKGVKDVQVDLKKGEAAIEAEQDIDKRWGQVLQSSIAAPCFFIARLTVA